MPKVYIVMESYTNDEYLLRQYISRIFANYESAEEYMLEAERNPIHVNVKYHIEAHDLHQ